MSDRFGNIPIQQPESSRPAPKPPKNPAKVKAVKKSPKAARPFNKIWGLAVGLLIIFTCYSAIGFWGVPYFVKKILPARFHEKTGMTLEPSTVSFNPFTFLFETGALRVLSETGTPIIALDSTLANVAPVAVLRRNLVCTKVSVNKLDLNISRNLDGGYNFKTLLGAEKDNNILTLFDFSNLPFFFSFNNISITNSKITFNDVPTGKIHTVEQIQLELPTLANIPFQTDQYLPPYFSAIINGSPIELTGQARLGTTDRASEGTKLALDIHDLDLTNYTDYFPVSLPMDVKKGKANGKVTLFFNPQNKTGDKLSIDFQLQLSETELIKHNQSLGIEIPAAQVNGSLQPVSKTLHLTEITLKEPIVSSFGQSFLDNVTQPAKEDEQGKTPATAQDAQYTLIIDLLLVDKGTVRKFSEKSSQLPSSTWNAIQLAIKNYHSAPGNITGQNDGIFSLTGEKDGSPAYFSWQGTFSSSKSLTGSLTLIKMDADDILKTSAQANKSLELKGSTDLKGQLIFYVKEGAPFLLKYKLLDAELAIENFAILDKKQTLLAAPFVKFAPLSFEDGEINLGNAQVQKGTAQFSYNQIPTLIAEINWRKYRLKGVDFAGQATFTPEQKSGQPLVLTDVSLKANELDGTRQAPNNFSVSAKMPTNGIVKAQGTVALAPFSLALKTGFHGLPAKKVMPFFSSLPSLNSLEGNLSGKGQFQLPGKSFVGELELTDVSGKLSQSAPFSWQKSILHNVNYTAEPFHFGITSASIEQGRFSWEITKNDNGPMQYLSGFINNFVPENKRQLNKQPSDKQKISISPVDIQEISFTNSTINIQDQRLTPAWNTVVHGFTGTIKDIHTSAAAGTSAFSFSGKLDESPFTLGGEFDPFARQENGKFHFSLKNFPVASFHKQLASKTDIDTSNGTMELTLDCRWQNQQYSSTGTLRLNNLEATTDTSVSALPLALLSGAGDTIRLPFNVLRTAPVGQTSLVDELLTSFQTQIVKGSVSPLLLAQGDFTDLIGNEFIEFQPGTIILSGTGTKTLTRYVSLLHNHPRVGLVLSGGFDQSIDREAMRKSLTKTEQQRVEKINEKLFQKWQEEKALFEKSVQQQQQKISGPNAQIAEQDIPPRILAGFKPVSPEPIVIDQTMLLGLAQQRIHTVFQYLTAQLTEQQGRISIISADTRKNGFEEPVNGVFISLKAISAVNKENDLPAALEND